MNKRIKELVNESWCSVSQRIGFNDAQRQKLFEEKFAELLVRECAKFMDENSGYNDSDGCWFPEPEDMLKHFGVEE